MAYFPATPIDVNINVGVGLPYQYNCDATPTKQAVKASAGIITGICFVNTSASWRYVKIFNKLTGSVTLGTTAADISIPVPPGGGVAKPIIPGWKFSTGILFVVTGGVSLTDNTSVTANDVVCQISWA